MTDIKELERKYFWKDAPIPYRLLCGETIYIHPILVKDFDVFEENHGILVYDKNATSNIEIIQMSYLQFLTDVIFNQVEGTMMQLNELLTMCLKPTKEIGYYFLDNGKPMIRFDCETKEEDGVEVLVGGIDISSADFNDIKRIILYQNLIDYDDTEISADVKKIIDDMNRLKASDIDPISLQTKVNFLGGKSSMTKKEILELTYRDFDGRFRILLDEIDYNIQKTCEMSGNVKFKKPVDHFIYKKKTNKFAQFFSDTDSVKQNIVGADGQIGTN